MSAAPSPSSAVETSLTSPPPKLTFAERFRWLGIVGNGVLVGGMLAYLLQFPPYQWPSPAEQGIISGILATIFTFPIGWALLVQWFRVRDAWAGLFVPILLAASALWIVAVIDPTSALTFSFDVPHRARPIIVAYLLVFGALWPSGLRLLDRKCLATSWQRGQFSIRTIISLTVMTALYAAVVADFAADGAISKVFYGRASFLGWHVSYVYDSQDLAFAWITSHAAILAFVVSMSGYTGWGLTALAGVILFGVSRLLTSPWGYFNPMELKHGTYYVSLIFCFTAAMSLPWVLLGWRVVWTPPLWDRSWRGVTQSQP